MDVKNINELRPSYLNWLFIVNILLTLKLSEYLMFIFFPTQTFDFTTYFNMTAIFHVLFDIHLLWALFKILIYAISSFVK